MNKILIIAFLGVISFIIFFVIQSSNNEAEYVEKINLHWEEYNTFLKNSTSSPVTDKASFKGITFFEPNSDYKIDAEIELIQSDEIIELQTNQKDVRTYVRFAYLHFNLLGKQCKLTLFQNKNDKSDYFLPFSDKTNALSTYSAGRYINVNVGSLRRLSFDFNKAMNPYCFYNKNYSCPIPPKENYLNFKILAGQKKDTK